MSRTRFLVDECLSVELAGLAWERGYKASHLRDLDLLGRKDAERNVSMTMRQPV